MGVAQGILTEHQLGLVADAVPGLCYQAVFGGAGCALEVRVHHHDNAARVAAHVVLCGDLIRRVGAPLGNQRIDNDRQQQRQADVEQGPGDGGITLAAGFGLADLLLAIAALLFSLAHYCSRDVRVIR